MARVLKLALLYLSKAVGLFRVARWLTRDKLRILGYHGFSLGDEHRFRPGVFMKPGVFRRRLAYLARTRTPVLALDEALERLQAGRLPPCATVITIDDGFYSVYDRARPVLAEFRCPATVYVTSYYCQHPHPVFRLAVQYLYWKSGPGRACADRATSRGQSAPDSPSGPCPLDRPVLADENAASAPEGTLPPAANPAIPPSGVHPTMWSLIQEGETAGDEARRVELCWALAGRLGVDYGELCRSRRLSLMTPAELHQLMLAGIDVQLHTHRHRLPARPAEAAQEIEENRAFLRAVTDRPLVHFCYPSGQWSAEHWPILTRLGIRSAVTCDPGLNDRSTPRLALRRTLDSQDMAQIEFEAEVSGLGELWRTAWRSWPFSRNKRRSADGCSP